MPDSGTYNPNLLSNSDRGVGISVRGEMIMAIAHLSQETCFVGALSHYGPLY
jgi:hypothetical protein